MGPRMRPPGAPPIPRQRVVAGPLDDWGASLTLAPEKELVIDRDHEHLPP